MAADNPFFSICIPAYNPFPFLQSTIETITSQSFADWEIIIVDDYSDRNVCETLGEFGFILGDKIKCIRLDENKGPFYARKIAFEASSGTYILCLDADDELVGHRVLEELHSSIVCSSTQPDVVIFNAVTSRLYQKSWIDYGSLGLHDGLLEKDAVIRVFLETYQLNNLCLKAIKSNMLRPVTFSGAVGMYMCEDRLEVAGVIAKADSYLMIDKPLYYYRQNPTSTTHRLFELDYCRQQSHVESTVASLFSGKASLDGLYRLFLLLWADDMCRLTQGRSLGESVDCFKVLARDSFFVEACRAIGTRDLRIDRRLLLSLLTGGYYIAAVIAANVIGFFISLVKAFVD